MAIKLGEPEFYYETDPEKSEKAIREFWEKAIALLGPETKSKEKSA